MPTAITRPDPSPETLPARGVRPLSPVQMGVIYGSGLHSRAGTYHGQSVFEMSGPVQIDLIGQALQWMMERHPALRSGVATRSGGDPVLAEADELRVPLLFEDSAP